MYDFGLLLKQLRESKGMSQATLAKKINRTDSVISKYENNTQSPSLETLIQFALIFNVSLDYIAGIDSKNAVSLRGLTPEQETIILELAETFRNSNIHQPHIITKQQLDIINQIIVEFAKKD